MLKTFGRWSANLVHFINDNSILKKRDRMKERQKREGLGGGLKKRLVKGISLCKPAH